MRAVIFVLLGMGLLLGCNEGPDGEAKLFIKKKASAFYYAEYKFTHSDYEDVSAAVRIEYQGSVLKNMQIKDLSNTATPLEEMDLSKNGSMYNGSTQGDHGGSYRVYLSGNSCCGSIMFTPTADTSANFWGVKSKDLTEDEWDSLTSSSPADEYFYARYEFTHDDYDTANAAVRIKNDMSTMDIKTLSDPDNPPAQSMTLTINDTNDNEYDGTVAGSEGGAYKVFTLDSGACCGNITFTPTNTEDIIVGTKTDQKLTKAEWDTMNQTASGTLSPAALGTKQVGKLFSVKATEGTVDVTMSLEAHSASAKVDKALAYWAAKDDNAYAVSKMLTGGKGEFEVFLTEAALSSVTKLVGLVGSENKGEATITPAANSSTNKLGFSGNFVLYSFSTGAAAPDIMIVDATGTVVEAGSTTKFGTNNLVINGSTLVTCSSPQIVFAKTTENIYQASCP